MIDYTKPIEYIDGSPARYLGRNPDVHRHTVTPRGRPQHETGNFYDDDGDHIYQEYMSIRNVDSIQAAITLLTDNNYTVTPPPPSQAQRDAVAGILSIFGFDSTAELIRQGHFADKIHKIKDLLRHDFH